MRTIKLHCHIKQATVAVLLATGLWGCATAPDVVVEETAPTQPVLPVEQQLANTLRAAPNQYALSKRAITPIQQASFAQAINALNNGDTDLAKSQLAKHMSTPQLPSAFWVLLGDVLLQEGDQAGAITQYHEAVIQNPSNYFALNRLGTQYRQKGQFETAMRYYQKAIDAWPGYDAAYHNMGILMDLYLGDKSAAIDMYANYQALVSYPVQGDVSKRDVKRIKRWIADVNRQLPETANQENSNE